MEFTFKHTGKASTEIADEKTNLPQPLMGIKTPLRPGRGASGLFDMHLSRNNLIRDNLKNLLMTNHGERIGQYDFGANLQELLFEMQSGDFDSRVVERVSTAVGKYMPYISLQELQVTDSSMENLPEGATIKLKIIYNVNDLGIKNDSIEILMRTEA
jgi:phage baseplate assembly protein W